MGLSRGFRAGGKGLALPFVLEIERWLGGNDWCELNQPPHPAVDDKHRDLQQIPTLWM